MTTNGHATKAPTALDSPEPNRAARRATVKAAPRKRAPTGLEPTELEIRVALLEKQLGEMRWCFKELLDKAKAQREAAIRKALEDPNQREAIIAQITNQMD